MKRFLFFLFSLSLAVVLQAQLPKRVYITLDVSGSMAGDKYALANYTTQMIVSLCDDDDIVSMIVTGKEHKFSRNANPLEELQHPILQFPLASGLDRDDEFLDIIIFNRLYKPSRGMQDWLFVIGDGEWETDENRYKQDRTKFKEIVQKGTLNVCYLQTNVNVNVSSDFTAFASTLGVIDIDKSDSNPQTIKDGCDHFARRILGFSDIPLKKKKSGGNSISIKAELPVRSFYLVYQDETTPALLPHITQATVTGNTLQTKLKGTPTTIPVKDGDVTVDLSGNVWRIDAQTVIPANTEIVVSFDKEIDPDNIRIYPMVENIGVKSSSLTIKGGFLTQVDDHTFVICRDEDHATVRVELDGVLAEELPITLLKQTKVIVRANNKDYEAKFKDGGFECDIDLIDQETQYYAECDCPGHFRRTTPIMTIKKGDCDTKAALDNLPVVEGPSLDYGAVTFEQLKHDPIRFSIRDSLSGTVLNPELFDIGVEIENDFLYENPKIHIEDDTLVVLELHPKGDWCECLFPETPNIMMISTPKKEAFEIYGHNYHKTAFPINIKIEKGRPWMARCFWVIIATVLLLLLFFYVRALQHKRRFKKSATVTPTYYNYYGSLIDDQGPTFLRMEGFGAWFARWFLPGDEQRILHFDAPETDIRFVAADSNEVVNLPKEGDITDSEKIHINGYKPDKDDQPKEPVKMGNGDRITVYKSNGDIEGYLTFNSGEKSDGRGFRVFLSLLQLASLAGALVLIYLMIKSYF